MNFLNLVLFPFAILYDLITRFRNYLYDSGIKRSFEFETNVISVGNLSVGGTGKSPMVEYLIRLLSDNLHIATLSRGYGRKTKGFRIASEEDSARTLGDEPYQFHKKFDRATVAVGEERAIAIPFILAEKPETNVILLDDAFQHRPVKPGFSILLTDFSKPFFSDFLLPAGRLREARKGANRADVIIVTKCPSELSDTTFEIYSSQVRRHNPSASVFFTSIRYSEPVAVFEGSEWSENTLLFSGIADSSQLKSYSESKFNLCFDLDFADHHTYRDTDFEKIKAEFDKVGQDDKCILTTEKDAVKLLELPEDHFFRSLPVFYLPIETVFLKDGKRFDELVKQSIKSYS